MVFLDMMRTSKSHNLCKIELKLHKLLAILSDNKKNQTDVGGGVDHELLILVEIAYKNVLTFNKESNSCDHFLSTILHPLNLSLHLFIVSITYPHTLHPINTHSAYEPL